MQTCNTFSTCTFSNICETKNYDEVYALHFLAALSQHLHSSLHVIYYAINVAVLLVRLP